MHSHIISHLLFAYETILFLQDAPKAIDSLMQVLRSYETASRQQVNLHKSSLYFRPSTSQARRVLITTALGTLKFLAMDRYLCFPRLLGRRKVVQYDFSLERVREKLASWKSATLS